MKLQTSISLSKQSKNQIGYHSNLLLLGSCFVENIGNKLSYFKFNNLLNPFGILFHPKAIEVLVSNAINKKEYSEKDIFLYNEQWHCYDAHSKMNNPSKDSLIQELNNQIQLTQKHLASASHIVITLGTAWAYKHKQTNKTVANCHKVPQKEFSKELFSIEDIHKSLENIVDLIRNINTNASIIFTVSPVRHIKDGFTENTVSKAHLISAIHQLINNQSSIKNNQLFYFPSYEIMMDELRDYRFYAEDMLHPNQTAIDYIWERFAGVWVSSNALKTMEEVEVIQKGLLHKPFNPNSEAHAKFLQQLKLKIELLQTNFPHLKF